MQTMMGRDLMNNPKTRDEASRMAAEESILSCIKNTAARIFCFLYSVVMFNAWVTINMLLSATSRQAGKRRVTQTQLKVNLTFVLARHGLDPGEPPDPDCLSPY